MNYPILIRKYDVDENSTYGDGKVLNIDFFSTDDCAYYGIRLEKLKETNRIMIDLNMYYQRVMSSDSAPIKAMKLDTKVVNKKDEDSEFKTSEVLSAYESMVKELIVYHNIPISASTKLAIDSIGKQEIESWIMEINDIIYLSNEAVQEAERILASARG